MSEIQVSTIIRYLHNDDVSGKYCRQAASMIVRAMKFPMEYFIHSHL